jgi:hypothetical protein
MPVTLLSVDPPREFVFQGTTGVEEQQTLTLTNTTDGFVSYKVKTTSPDAYLVRPSAGCLAKGKSVQVKVLLQPNTRSAAVENKDRFLLLCVKTETDRKLEKEEWEALQKPELEWVRLSVSFRSPELSPPSEEADLKARYEELHAYTLGIEKEKKGVDDELAALKVRLSGGGKSAGGYPTWMLFLVVTVSFVVARVAFGDPDPGRPQ